MRLWVVMPVLAAACGGTGSPPPRPKPAPLTVAAPPSSAAPASVEVPAPAPLETGYGDSPLTPLANEVTRLVAVLLEGRSPEAGPLPLDRIRSLDKLLRDPHGAPKTHELAFLGVAFELDIVFVPLISERPSDADPDGALVTIVLVTKTGAKLAALDVGGPRRPRVLGDWLKGAEGQGTALVEAIGRGQWSEITLGEAERSLFADDPLFDKLGEDLPSAEEMRRAQALVRAHPKAVGFHMDDMIVLARDADRGFWGFALQLDERDGQTVLDTGPLVRVERLDAKRGF